MNSKQIILLLALAQFVFTLDTTFMNVSISTLVKDLDTTVTGIQSAITLYSLVMASLMIAGAKIGDIIGRKRAFTIGLVIYGVGSFITGLSQNLPTLIFGWSFLEGVGAALVIPAMMSLVTGNFREGAERVKAYGTLAAIAALGAAAGPIVGGLLTTYASWRWGFIGEVLVVLYVLLNRRSIKDAPVATVTKGFDSIGLILSALGLTTIVAGVLMANTYGFFVARQDFMLGNTTIISKGGISPVIWTVALGVMILGFFIAWQWRRFRLKKPFLVTPELFSQRTLRPAAVTQLAMQVVMAGLIFSFSLFLQVALNYSAFQTGLTLLPLSIAVLAVASQGARIAARFSSRRIIQSGFVVILVGVVLAGLNIGKSASGVEFIPTMLLVGTGIGLVASQLMNLVQSSVRPSQTSEASGIMSTFQNLGGSLGTAVAGSVVVVVLSTTGQNLIAQSSVLTDAQKQELEPKVQGKVEVVSDAQLNTYLEGQPQEVVSEVQSINDQARDKALAASVIALAVVGLLGVFSSCRLPRTH